MASENSKKKENRFNAKEILQNIPMPYCILNDKATIIEGNEDFKSLFPRFNCVGFNLSSLFEPVHSKLFDSRFNAIFSKPDNKDFPLEISITEDIKKYFTLRFRYVLDGEDRFLITLWTDVTKENEITLLQKKKLQNEEAISQIYRQFLEQTDTEKALQDVISSIELIERYSTVNIFIKGKEGINFYTSNKRPAYRQILQQWSGDGREIPCLKGCLKDLPREYYFKREHSCMRCNIRYYHQNNFLFTGILAYKDQFFGTMSVELQTEADDSDEALLDRLRQQISLAIFNSYKIRDDKKIREENALLANVVRHSPVILIKWKSQAPHTIMYLSENAAQWGYDLDHILQNPPDFFDLLDKAYHGNLQKPGMNSIVKIKDGQGNLQWANMYLIKQEDRTTQSAVFTRIKDYKNLDESLHRADKLRALGELSGGVAHDFNNILTGIMGNADFALHYKNRDQFPDEELGNILTASERAKELISRILSFSRQDRETRKKLPLRGTVQDAVRLVRAGTGSKIRFIEDYSKKPILVYMNSNQIHEALVNLLQNASYAIDDRKGIISVKTREKTYKNHLYTTTGIMMPGRYAMIEISDDGCGISEQIIEKVLEPFFTTRREEGGSGLGLSVVVSIIKKHEGEIHIETQENQYTSFFIYLPLELRQKEGSREDSKSD